MTELRFSGSLPYINTWLYCHQWASDYLTLRYNGLSRLIQLTLLVWHYFPFLTNLPALLYFSDHLANLTLSHTLSKLNSLSLPNHIFMYYSQSEMTLSNYTYTDYYFLSEFDITDTSEENLRLLIFTKRDINNKLVLSLQTVLKISYFIKKCDIFWTYTTLLMKLPVFFQT